MSYVQALQSSYFEPQGSGPTHHRHDALLNRLPADDCMLQAGQARTVQARQAGVLRIVRGWAWITFRHADRDPSVQAGDHFLGRGDSLQLSAGQAVIMEALEKDSEKRVCFSWQPAASALAINIKT